MLEYVSTLSLRHQWSLLEGYIPGRAIIWVTSKQQQAHTRSIEFFLFSYCQLSDRSPDPPQKILYFDVDRKIKMTLHLLDDVSCVRCSYDLIW